jgi:hypothetical protein
MQSRSTRCLGLVAVTGSLIAPCVIGPLRAQTLPPSLPALLEKPQARPASREPSLVDHSSTQQTKPVKQRALGEPISVTCPPNAAPIGQSDDPRASGWQVRASWAFFLYVDVKNPASMNAGAVVNCWYGYTRGSLGGVIPMFELTRNVGAGIKAADCTVAGENVTCAGGVSLRCPPRSAHIGSDRIGGTDWLFETAWPQAHMRTKVGDPASMNAGAVASCEYGPVDVTRTPMVQTFTLRRNLGAGIEASMCVTDQASRTVTCARPL